MMHPFFFDTINFKKILDIFDGEERNAGRIEWEKLKSLAIIIYTVK